MSGGHIINLSAPRTAAMCKNVSAAIVENHWLRAVRNKLLTDGWLNMQRNTPEDLTCNQQIQKRPFLNPTGKSVGNSFHSLWSSYLQNTSTSYSFRLPEFVRGKDCQRKASTTSHAQDLNPHKNYFPCTPKNGYLSLPILNLTQFKRDYMHTLHFNFYTAQLDYTHTAQKQKSGGSNAHPWHCIAYV